MNPVTKMYFGTAVKLLIGVGAIALVAYLKFYCGFG